MSSFEEIVISPHLDTAALFTTPFRTAASHGAGAAKVWRFDSGRLEAAIGSGDLARDLDPSAADFGIAAAAFDDDGHLWLVAHSVGERWVTFTALLIEPSAKRVVAQTRLQRVARGSDYSEHGIIECAIVLSDSTAEVIAAAHGGSTLSFLLGWNGRELTVSTRSTRTQRFVDERSVVRFARVAVRLDEGGASFECLPDGDEESIASIREEYAALVESLLPQEWLDRPVSPPPPRVIETPSGRAILELGYDDGDECLQACLWTIAAAARA